MQQVLPMFHSRVLVYSSSLTTVTVVRSIQADFMVCALLSLTLLATSVNYWRHPTYGTRRKVDMGVAFVNIFYFALVATWYQVYLWYLGLFVGSICYYQARQSLTPSQGVCWHLTLHMVGNLANWYLFQCRCISG